MSESAQYELAAHIEHYLAALSKLYAREGHRQKLEIIVNSQIRVHEAWSSDNLNGGTYGHAIFFAVPEELYLSIVRQRDDLQKEISADLNKIHNVQNEFIAEVFLEMETVAERDWRKESGALQTRRPAISDAASRRIWAEGYYRLFLSHKTEVKKEAATLKTRLAISGISSFVAHEDIRPTKEWQDEIENALASMDAFVALLTEDFHDSLWTDQEVGFAVARGVPIIAVRLGQDPYGFIGKFQALSCTWKEAPGKLLALLINQPRMLDAYVSAVQSCSSFDNGNFLAEALPEIKDPSAEHIRGLVSAFNDNDELKGSFGFNGTKSRYYGDGLAAHLARITGRKYRIEGTGPEMRIATPLVLRGR